MTPLNVVLLTYEFTYSPFSGNGILARSLVKALLGQGCRLTVWCCRPALASSSGQEDNHLQTPEITPEQASRLEVYAVTLSEDATWWRLDEESAWQDFTWSRLLDQHHDAKSRSALSAAVTRAHVVCSIDWTGACAWRSLSPTLWNNDPHKNGIHRKRPPPLVYLNFRVYSSGVSDETKREWYNRMEQHALEDATSIIALSEKDRTSLMALMMHDDKKRDIVKVLLPPLRGDMEELARSSTSEDLLSRHLPAEVSSALSDEEESFACQRHRSFITCVVRLSPEKDTMRFVQFVEATRNLRKDRGFIPLLAGASSDLDYAKAVKDNLLRVAPESVILDSFLSPVALAAIFSRTALNFHPCSYDAFGMTVIEAAAFGVPSVIASGDKVGASVIVGSGACLSVEMPKSSPNAVGMMPARLVDEIAKAMRNEDRLTAMGVEARKRALAWDEAAYGKALLEHMRLAASSVQ